MYVRTIISVACLSFGNGNFRFSLQNLFYEIGWMRRNNLHVNTAKFLCEFVCVCVCCICMSLEQIRINNDDNLWISCGSASDWRENGKLCSKIEWRFKGFRIHIVIGIRYRSTYRINDISFSFILRESYFQATLKV